MSRILNTAVKDELIDRNPVPQELTNSSTGKAIRPPTDEELKGLLANLPPGLRLAACFAAYGGLRIGEWRALRRCDLTEQDGYWIIDVNRQALWVEGRWLETEPKSIAGIRLVPLPAWLSDDVAAHLANVPKAADALLFPGKNGYLTDMEWRYAFDRARKAIGLLTIVDGRKVSEVRGHDLRSYYATMLAKQGATAPQLMDALGHSSIAMSMRYVRKAKAANTRVADLIPKPEGVV